MKIFVVPLSLLVFGCAGVQKPTAVTPQQCPYDIRPPPDAYEKLAQAQQSGLFVYVTAYATLKDRNLFPVLSDSLMAHNSGKGLIVAHDGVVFVATKSHLFLEVEDIPEDVVSADLRPHYEMSYTVKVNQYADPESAIETEVVEINRSFQMPAQESFAHIRPDGYVVLRLPQQFENRPAVHLARSGCIQTGMEVYEIGGAINQIFYPPEVDVVKHYVSHSGDKDLFRIRPPSVGGASGSGVLMFLDGELYLVGFINFTSNVFWLDQQFPENSTVYRVDALIDRFESGGLDAYLKGIR